MIVNSAVLQALAVGLSDIFNTTFSQLKANSVYERLATVINMPNSTSVDYAWLSDVPSVREWISGDRQLKDLQAYKYTIAKKDYEATIGVSRDDIMFDRLAIVTPRIMDLASSGASHYDELIFKLIKDNGLAFDGANFFGTHLIKDTAGTTLSSYTNKATKKLSEDSLYDAIATMAKIKSDSNRPLAVRPNLLIVGPDNEGLADQLLNAPTKANGATNPLYKKLEVIVTAHFSGEEYALLDTTKSLKPFILQITKEFSFTAMDQQTDEYVFTKKIYRFGVDAMHNVGYSLPFLAFYSDGTVA